MQNMRIRPFPLLLVPILCAIGSTGCTSRTTAPNGECLADPAVQCGLPDASAEAIHLTGYSCTGTARPDENATYIDGVPQGTVCSDEACPVGTQPTAEDLGANKSRADLYYLLCPVPKLAANPKYETFCCFTSGLVPAGGSCQQDIEVPNCAPGKFGISCYGIDRPEQNFPRLTSCGDGVPGRSEQGYPATVYCCDFDRG